MKYSDESYNLRIELDTQGCDLSVDEIADMERDLHTLRELVEAFPVSNLHITVVHHAKRNDYHVKTSLRLCRTTLFTGDRDVLVHPAYERCIRKLVKKVVAYKQRMHGDADRAREASGNHHTLNATQVCNMEKLAEAVGNEDYAAFRRAADVFDEGLTERIGRWIQRYPEVESRLGETITISDIVEDVFLNAYAYFAQRPADVPPGDWFESFIDPTVQSLLQTPDDEFVDIRYSQAVLKPE